MSLTSQQYAALAKDAYDEPPETGASSRPVDIGGITYKRLEYVDSPSGYQGIIYQRIDTNEIIVAHRGTETERELKQDGVYGWSDQRRRRMSPTTSARLTALRSSI
ncbi:hypothetical protein QYZ35_21950, partial [Xanthomonas campestris pv. campestris]|nr:hypothetical protein [Xanthomonas campestris pv. campestris]